MDGTRKRAAANNPKNIRFIEMCFLLLGKATKRGVARASRNPFRRGGGGRYGRGKGDLVGRRVLGQAWARRWRLGREKN
jgi:hypothetical protein